MSRRPKLDAFTRAYLEAALWTDWDDDGEPLSRNYTIDDIAPESIRKAIADTWRFERENEWLLDEISEKFGTDDEQNGHDFWLTRNKHGVGFWDRGYGKLGDKLTKAAEKFGEVFAVVGDDGLVYIE